MRLLISDRVCLGENDQEAFFEPKQLTWKEQLSVAVRMFWERRSSIKKKRERRRIVEYQKHAEKVENLKLALTEQINRSTSTRLNKKLNNKTPMYVLVSVNRQFQDILKEVLEQKEFDGYSIEEYIANPDILQVYPDLPILIKFTRKVVGHYET